MAPVALPASDDLGALISEHHTRSSARGPLTLLSAASLLGALAAGGYAIDRWYFAQAHLGPAAVWRLSAPALGAAAALLALGCLWVALRLRSGPLRVEVRHDGLRWSRGRRSTSARWSQVRQVHTHAIRYLLPALGRRTQAELVLGLRPAGISSRRLRWLRLPHTLSHFDDLVAAVKTQAYPLLMAEATRALRQGRQLTFGPLRLSTKGMRHGRRLLRWSDLEQVRLDDGVVRLRASASSGHRELRLHAHRIPNLEVCLQLIDLLRRQS